MSRTIFRQPQIFQSRFKRDNNSNSKNNISDTENSDNGVPGDTTFDTTQAIYGDNNIKLIGVNATSTSAITLKICNPIYQVINSNDNNDDDGAYANASDNAVKVTTIGENGVTAGDINWNSYCDDGNINGTVFISQLSLVVSPSTNTNDNDNVPLFIN